MKKLAIISFDICRPGEPSTSYAMGSIIAALKSHHGYDEQFVLTHFGYNLYNKPLEIFYWHQEPVDWEQYDFIAVSCYIWSHKQALALMHWIKSNKLRAKVIAGGYQVNSNNINFLKSLYPNADYFISGHAENALADIVLGKTTSDLVKNEPDWNALPSPFISGAIEINQNVHHLRLETKRGCPFACTFCAQHEISRPKTHYYLHDRLQLELDFLADKGIQRISVTDPVFNMGNTYLPYLETISELGMQKVFNFQVRPELISAKKDKRFVELLADTQSQIELGMQTFDPIVNKLIKRGNQYGPIDDALSILLDNHIQFGISLIYGIPGQTLDSFCRDIDKVKKMGIKDVVAFPLMLLPGTEMYALKNTNGIVEKPLGEFQIPHVISSPTFTENEWLKMDELAGKLNPNGRLF